MERLAVLCTTMEQTDFSLVEKMNIRSDAVFTNQCSTYGAAEQTIDGHCIRMISTATRGVGINRNLGLLEAKNELFLLADDDVRYADDYTERVVRAFEELPEADVIAFRIDTIKDGELIRGRANPTKRRHTWNCLRYGACVLAVKRSAVLRANLSFTQLFGGGAIYCSGEDSLFLRDCVSKGLKFYSYDYCLGTTCKDTSSWFCGFDEKFFYDKGAWIAAAFRFGKPLLMRAIFRSYLQRTDLPRKTALRLIKQGIRGYRDLLSYDEFTTKTGRKNTDS